MKNSTMKKIPILSTILFPFFIISLSFIVTLLILYSSLEKLYVYQRTLSNTTLPELSEIFILTDEFNKVRSNIYRMMNDYSKLSYLSVLKDTRSKINKINQILFEMRKVSVYNEQAKELSKRIIELSNTVNEVEGFLIQRTSIIDQRQANIKKLRFFSENIESEVQMNLTNAKSISLLQSSIAHLMTICSDVNIFYGLRVIEKIEEKIKILKQIGKEENNLDKKTRKLMSEIISLTEEKYGVFPLFYELDTIQSKITSISIHLETLSNEIRSMSNFLLNQIHINASKNNEIFQENISYLYYIISITLILIVILSAILYRFITFLVINPLMSLNSFLELRSQGIREKLLHTGSYEIQTISHAVADFIDQIEEREEKLQESHANLESQVLERTSKITKLSGKIVKIQEKERFKLAAELHDDVGASMGVIKFSIERALKLLGTQTEQAQTALTEAVNIVKSVASQLRRIQTDLRPPYLDIGLLKTLEWFVLDYKTAHPDLQMQADFFFDEADLDSTMQIVIFRIIQEALNNISKYSQATKVTIQVIHDEELSVLIEDNGKGFPIEDLQSSPTQNSGHGIRNIQERVTISSGYFSISSTPGQGTCVRAIWDASVIKC